MLSLSVIGIKFKLHCVMDSLGCYALTEYAGHAKEIARTLKLEEWSGILIVSGDGLIFEVSLLNASYFQISIIITVCNG